MQATAASCSTLLDVLRLQAECRPNAEALCGVSSLSYEQLRRHANRTASALRRAGVRRGGRVAVVMPDSAAAACVQLAATGFGASCPFNPTYRREEFEAYFADLQPDAIVFEQGAATEARETAYSRTVPVLEFPATLEAIEDDDDVPDLTGADDVAIVLYTSGSTSKPKRVAIRHRHLIVAARAISRCYHLRPGDRCLNLVPLFHGFGLVSGFISSLFAGASVICGPEMHAANFAALVEEWQPTWYTGVPAMHRVIVDQMREGRMHLPPNRLRFTISRAGPLPPSLQEEVEDRLGIPILQGYGATETTTLACCTSLSRMARKRGSVGRSLGPEIAIVDENLRRLPAGLLGEILIHGENVVEGYENAPEATRQSFVRLAGTNGAWFRTGDVGYLDRQGYLFITGRTKEVINRGGEKISPYEVEDVLLRHPDVAEAAVFPMPHARLGEEVAAAIVLRDGRTSTAHIADFAAAHLAPFKRPRAIVALAAMPATRSGKVRRLKLAEVLAKELALVSVACERVAPRTLMEEQLLKIWKDVLKIDGAGIHDRFFELGGDSLQAAEMLVRVRRRFKRDIPLEKFARTPTLEALAKLASGVDPAAERPMLAAIHTRGERPPLFNVIAGFFLSHEQTLSRCIGDDQPYYALIPDLRPGGAEHGLGPASIARHCVETIRSVQPHGPYFLCGISSGGVVAFHIAQQLVEEGESIGLLGLIDSSLPDSTPSRREQWLDAVDLQIGRLMALPPRGIAKWLLVELRSTVRRLLHLPQPAWAGTGKALETGVREMPVVEPRPYPGRIVQFYAEESLRRGSADRRLHWSKVAQGGLEVRTVPGDHLSMTEEPNVRELAKAIRHYLDAADAEENVYFGTAARSASSISFSGALLPVHK